MIGAALVLTLLSASLASPARAQAPGLMGCDLPSIPRMPLLMPDDFSELNLVTWRVERGTPDPNNPLIEGDMPWDSGGVGIHGSVFKDPIDSLWKAYLVCTPPEFAPWPEQPWASDNAAYRRLCLFESANGVHWTRPKLSNESIGEHTQTNVLFDLTQGVSAYPSILVDPNDREWPYTMIALREHQGSKAHGVPPQGNGYYRYRSKDGKKWEPMGKVEGPMNKWDLAFFYRNPEGGNLCYYRASGDRRPTDHVPSYEDCPRRSCYLATSQDGKTWVQDPAMAITADDLDHRDTQYQECVPLKVPGGYVAMVTMYHPISQTLNLRMAASRDGRQWWFPDRVPCFDNAPFGDYGGGMIWQNQNLIVQGKTLWVYYGGTEGAHRQISDTRIPSIRINPLQTVADKMTYFLPFNAALCRASWRLDRMYALASSAGGPTVGEAVTTARELGGAGLWVDLRTRPAKKVSQPGFHEGCLQVELLDKDGKPLPGFGRADCIALKGDHEAVQVKWTGGDTAPQDAKKAKFYLLRAFLYGFEFRKSEASAASTTEKARPQTVELRPYLWEGPYTKMRSKVACPHDDGLCAEVRAPWMAAGERLILRTSEIVGYDLGYLYDDHFPTQEQKGRGKDYKHTAFRWDTTGAPRELSAACEVPGKGRFRLSLAAEADYVDIELAVRNDLTQVMRYVDWYFCPVAYEAPSIVNPSLDRTYFFDGSHLCKLASGILNSPNETMFLVGGDRGSNGFIPPLHAANPRGAMEAKAPIVLIENNKATHTIALAFERAHTIFCSPGNACFHADPYFGPDLQPGEERSVRGRLYLAAGSPNDIFKRFQSDFPNR
jgi:hypothetical protein